MTTKSKNRLPCPDCAELILPNAKKCRYCGKKISKKSKKLNPPNKFSLIKPYRVWLGSMVSFYILTFIMRNHPNSDYSMDAFKLLTLVVIVGSIAFIKFLRNLVMPVNRIDAGKFTIITAISLFFFFFTLFNLEKVEAALGLGSNIKSINQYENQGLKSPTPSPKNSALPSPSVKSNQPSTTSNSGATSNNSNNVECIGPDNKKFTTTMTECERLNNEWGKSVNYMLNCHFPQECGGGTRYISKSECDTPCTPTTTTRYPTTNNNNSNGSLDYYCYNNYSDYWYYTSSGEQCNLDNLKAGCLSIAKSVYYDPCMDTCLQNANNGSAYCIYNLPEELQDACLDENSTTYQSCMDACGATYQSEQGKCY